MSDDADTPVPTAAKDGRIDLTGQESEDPDYVAPERTVQTSPPRQSLQLVVVVDTANWKGDQTQIDQKVAVAQVRFDEDLRTDLQVDKTDGHVNVVPVLLDGTAGGFDLNSPADLEAVAAAATGSVPTGKQLVILVFTGKVMNEGAWSNEYGATNESAYKSPLPSSVPVLSTPLDAHVVGVAAVADTYTAPGDGDYEATKLTLGAHALGHAVGLPNRDLCLSPEDYQDMMGCQGGGLITSQFDSADQRAFSTNMQNLRR